MDKDKDSQKPTMKEIVANIKKDRDKRDKTATVNLTFLCVWV